MIHLSDIKLSLRIFSNAVTLAFHPDMIKEFSNLKVEAEEMRSHIQHLNIEKDDLLQINHDLEQQLAEALKIKNDLNSLVDYTFDTGVTVLVDALSLRHDKKLQESHYVLVNKVQVPIKSYCVYCAENKNKHQLQQNQNQNTLDCRFCGSSYRFFQPRTTVEIF